MSDQKTSGKLCHSCGRLWWFFDECCSNPVLNPPPSGEARDERDAEAYAEEMEPTDHDKPPGERVPIRQVWLYRGFLAGRKGTVPRKREGALNGDAAELLYVKKQFMELQFKTALMIDEAVQAERERIAGILNSGSDFWTIDDILTPKEKSE